MPVVSDDSYRPPLLCRFRHVNTVYPYLLRRVKGVSYTRQRYELSDGDFVDLDTVRSDNNRAVIFLHGLEGSSGSQYMLSHAKIFAEAEWDVICMNHRSCSGEMNRLPHAYHSGFTHDLREVVDRLSPNYNYLAIVGFSLGGNITLKYCNDEVYPVPTNIAAVAAVSTPISLNGCSTCISSTENRVYDYNFLRTLKEKMVIKSELFPDYIDWKPLRSIRRLVDFDEYITGPLHGYEGAEDYYTRCSSKQFLHRTNIPTLLIQALDDPFLDKESYPYAIAEKSDFLHFLPSKYGGHLGFTTFGARYYWSEHKVFRFISEVVGDVREL